MAELRWGMEILRWGLSPAAETICAFLIPGRDRCPAGLAMWWSEGLCGIGFSLCGFSSSKHKTPGGGVLDGTKPAQAEVYATKSCVLALLVYLFVFAGPCWATTYYVAAAGSDT